ncbi:MAG TPA: hypothetical protein VE863_06350 [Pyrinomonadaceae bacterium]|nr:hypothetical protein [Pyrinomonadaceae bacterium]
MNTELARQIIETYQKHNWKLRRILFQPCARNEREQIDFAFPATPVEETEFNALWFSRPSHGGREAWELRLVAETPYALFEAFEADESEADREDARREMENKMREYAVKA